MFKEVTEKGVVGEKNKKTQKSQNKPKHSKFYTKWQLNIKKMKKRAFYFKMTKRKGELTEGKRSKTEQKEGNGYERNINGSEVFQSIVIKYTSCNFLRSHQRTCLKRK